MPDKNSNGEIDKKFDEIERKLKILRDEQHELTKKQNGLNNLLMRLAASQMAIADSLQKKKIIEPKSFEEAVDRNLGNLDQELTDRKIQNILNQVWKGKSGD